MNQPSDQIRSDQSLSRVRLFETPWIAVHQASLSITNSQSSFRLTSIKSVMPSSHLILCCPLLLLPQIPPSIRVFSNESTLRMRWPKYWSFSFSIITSKEIPGICKSPPFWISLLSLSPSHPSRLIQSPCLSFLRHTENSRWLFYIWYVSFHVALSIHLTFSSPLPMSISLFSMSVSPLLPCK